MPETFQDYLATRHAKVCAKYEHVKLTAEAIRIDALSTWLLCVHRLQQERAFKKRGLPSSRTTGIARATRPFSAVSAWETVRRALQRGEISNLNSDRLEPVPRAPVPAGSITLPLAAKKVLEECLGDVWSMSSALPHPRMLKARALLVHEGQRQLLRTFMKTALPQAISQNLYDLADRGEFFGEVIIPGTIFQKIETFNVEHVRDGKSTLEMVKDELKEQGYAIAKERWTQGPNSDLRAHFHWR